MPGNGQFTIQTVAGGGPADGTAATSVSLQPSGVAIGSGGNVYIASMTRVFRVDTSGKISTAAGTGGFGYFGDGGPAAKASIGPWGVAIDSSGNLYITDRFNHRVRKVDGAGVITTIAGTGIAGALASTNGSATTAQLDTPSGIAVDNAGNVFIADTNNHRVVRVSAAGTMSTIAGSAPCRPELGDGGAALSASLCGPAAVAVDAQGIVYIADTNNHRIRKVTAGGQISTVAGSGSSLTGGGFGGDGGLATAAAMRNPYAVTVDAAGNLFIADSGNNRIRKVIPSGVISTVAGVDTAGYSGDGGPAVAAQLSFPIGIAVNVSGVLSIADQNNGRVRQVAISGVISTLAGAGLDATDGDGGPATSAQVQPAGLAIDSTGNLIVSHNGTDAGRVRKVNGGGVISTIAGSGRRGFTGDGGAASSATFSILTAVAADSSGNVYVANSNGNYRIRKIDSTGTIRTVVGDGTSGNSGDGGPATSAKIGPFVGGMVVDGGGNLLFSDSFPPNGRIRKVTPSSVITTIAGSGGNGFSGDGGAATTAQLNTPWGLALDAAGNLYIADSGNHRIRKVSTDGVIRTIAGNGNKGFAGDGGLATAAMLDSPMGVAVDGNGNVYISDSGNNRIRRVTSSGIITSIAGDGVGAFAGDGGPAINAKLNNPGDLRFDASGKLYIADSANQRVRVLTPSQVLVEPASLSFAYQTGGTLPAARTLQVNNTAGSEVATASVAAGGSWLRVTAVTSTNPVTFSVSADPGNLGAGTYPGVIRLAVGGNTIDVPVTLQITGCGYTVTPASPNGFAAAGGTRNVTVNATAAGCPWTASASASWITFPSGAAGTGNGTVSFQVAANPSGADRTGSITIAGETITVVQVGGLYFVPVVPCRIADTRNANGPFGGPRMAAQEARNFTVPVSSCGIPLNAAAYSLNVTVVPAGPLGFLTAWPSGQARPLVSTLNSFDGRIKANAAIVPAGSGGAISIFVTDASDVILDINGYFVPGATSGLRFFSVNPCRIADTRLANGVFGGPLITAGQSRSFPIPESGCGIPGTAQAYSFNVTSVPSRALGFLTAWPAGSTRPLVSTLNAPTGTVTANAAIVPAGSNGAISVFATDDSHVVLDINGYFAASGSGQPLVFSTLEPCRVADTRLTTNLAAGEIRSIPTMTRCGIPIAPIAEALSLNATVVPKGALPYLTLWATFGPQPFVSTLNAFDGSVVANAAIVPASIGVNVFAASATDVILDVNGYFKREFVP